MVMKKTGWQIVELARMFLSVRGIEDSFLGYYYNGRTMPFGAYVVDAGENMICGAFTWDKSDEGADYWMAIDDDWRCICKCFGLTW